MIDIDVSKVRSVYSGRPGCACGCRGTYKHAAAHRASAQAHQGYPIADDEVSDRSVTLIVNKIARIADGEQPGFIEYVCSDFVSAYNGPETRSYTLYWDVSNPEFVEQYGHLARYASFSSTSSSSHG